MITLHYSHALACDVSGFWRGFFDAELNHRLYTEILHYPRYEVLEFHETGGEIRRRVTAQPHIAMPAPIRKLFSDRITYLEEGTFEKSVRIWRWIITSGTFPVTVRYDGHIEARPSANGACERLAQVTIAARAPVLRGMVERVAAAHLDAVMDVSAHYLDQWIPAAR